jgi:maleylacetate reductase
MNAEETPRFQYQCRGLRVVLGPGAALGLGEEVERLGCRRAAVLTTPGRAATLGPLLDALAQAGAGAEVPGAEAGAAAGGGAGAPVWDGARVHVPREVVDSAVAWTRAAQADALVAVGGGSAIGVAKAVVLETGLPIVAVPTTYSGSEMTSIWGITDGERKQTGRNPRVAPRTVLYDPLLTLDLPARTSAASGMNAMAHAVEALYAPDRNPVASLLAEEAVRVLARALPRVVDAPRTIFPRSEAFLGAHLAAQALEVTTMGLHHRLCHVMGGMFDLPHARLHALLLPHVVGYQGEAAPEAMARLGRGLGRGTEAAPEEALHALNARLGLRENLKDLGLTQGDLDRAAAQAPLGDLPHPERMTVEGIRGILESAWTG